MRKIQKQQISNPKLWLIKVEIKERGVFEGFQGKKELYKGWNEVFGQQVQIAKIDNKQISDKMNKRKIDVNQIKKGIVRAKKYRNINVKYEVMLSYFKQKDVKDMKIFQITFPPLIEDILTELLTAEFVFKLEEQCKEPLKSISIGEDMLKLQTFYLKGLSKQYPIQEICECLYVEKNAKNNMKTLSIHKNKLMVFFKKLRLIYTDFCYCVGEKYIVEGPQLRNFYEAFKSEWSKSQQKGRLCEKGKLQKRLCRSLFFLGVLIENNIYEAIQVAERKKRQETDDLGTKSQKKKNIKGITQNHQSSTYSFGSTDLMSNFSLRLKSQKSEQDDYYMKDYYYKNPYSEYSQKSQRIVSRPKFGLFDKIQIKNLKGKCFREPKSKDDEDNEAKYEINYLSNDVENILIQQAFKIRKFKDSCQRNEYYAPNPYYYVNYMGYYQEYDYSYHQNMGQNMGYQFYDPSFIGGYQTNTVNFNANPSNNGSINVIYEQGDEVNRLGRSFDFYNLVETRKSSHRFNNKKNNK